MEKIVGYEKADFGVEKRKLYLADGVEITDHKAITRVDNGKVLGLVGNNYQVVPHSQVLDAFDSVPILKGKRLDVCRDGGVMFATYDIKDNGGLKMAEVKKGDVVSFGIRVFNSYNQKFGVGFELVANRLVCTNGLIVPRAIARLSMRHFESVRVDRFKELIDVRMGQIEPTVNRWKEWLDIKPREAVVKDFFDGIRSEKLGVKERERLYADSLKENEKLGVWGIYNVFTKYVTHELKVRNEANRMLAVREREQAILYKFYNYAWSKN